MVYPAFTREACLQKFSMFMRARVLDRAKVPTNEEGICRMRSGSS